jgi:hypothetical protein
VNVSLAQSSLASFPTRVEKKIPESSTSKAYILSSEDREGGLESLGHVLLGVLLYGVLQVIGVICNSPGLQQLQM